MGRDGRSGRDRQMGRDSRIETDRWAKTGTVGDMDRDGQKKRGTETDGG